jgi:hypothetical protein
LSEHNAEAKKQGGVAKIEGGVAKTWNSVAKSWNLLAKKNQFMWYILGSLHHNLRRNEWQEAFDLGEVCEYDEDLISMQLSPWKMMRSLHRAVAGLLSS